MSKLTATDVAEFVAGRTGAANDDVLVGPAPGEDAAAIRTEDGILVVSSDPISLAADRIGDIGVAVASNDVAAAGAAPEFLVSTILLPDLDADLLDQVTGQLDRAAERLGLTIVGGHTEAVPALERPLLSLTCMGYTDRFVSTGGASPGDRLILTKGAGIEATAILASDFADDARAAGVDDATIDAGLACFDDLSVMPEAAALAPVATAMHDPTEGGVVSGLVELGLASDCRLVVDADAVPVREATRDLCAALDLDPLQTLGSGALLAAVPEDEVDDALDALHGEDIVARDIGVVEAGDAGVDLGGTWHDSVPTDAMYALWE